MDEGSRGRIAAVRGTIAVRVDGAAHCRGGPRHHRVRLFAGAARAFRGDHHAERAALRAAPQWGSRHPSSRAPAPHPRTGRASPDLRPRIAVALSTGPRIHFIECSGNSAGLFAVDPPQGGAGALHGLLSCSDWTGVPLSTLLDEVGVRPAGKWLLAEGADAAAMSRSIPIERPGTMR